MEELASVYARSLFEAADDADKLDELREQLGQFADALDADRDMQVFFFSPHLTAADKKDGVQKAVTGADDLFVNFLGLLIDNQRMPALMRIRREYDLLWERENKLLPVQVVSAVDLDDAIVERIGDQIAEQTGQKVELSSEVDPDVIGGLVVRVGNTVLDASVRNRLQTLRREIVRS